jgi:hypothetical protein
MGQFCLRQVRALAAVLPILIVWLAFAGGAHAAVPNFDKIDQTTHPSTAWEGDFYAAAPANGDPQFCPPTTASDAACDHFELTTTNAGPVRVSATWPCTAGNPNCAASPCAATPGTCDDPSAADFDILVCLNGVIDIGEQFPPIPDGMGGFLPNPGNPNNTPPDACVGGTEVAFFTGNTPGFEGGVFQAAANTTYEIRVIPVFVLNGSDYQGCAEYTSVSTATCALPPVVTPPPVGASEFAQGCAPDTKNRQLDGGGTVPGLSAPKAPFSINVRRSVDSHGQTHFRGKVNYGDDKAVRFRSKNATCATFIDGTPTSDNDHSTTFRGSAEVRGFGTAKLNGSKDDTQVCYKAIGQDWGQPGQGKDKFHIELYALTTTAGSPTCSGTPIYVNDQTITDGNIKYKFVPEGNDDDEHDG